jgi:hypothetical protein
LVLVRSWFDIFRNDHGRDQAPIYHRRIFIFCFADALGAHI